MNAAPRLPLAALVRGIDAAVTAPLERRPILVAEALAAHAGDPALLLDHPCPSSSERYVRHLLHADPYGGYALVALVWRPGQMSPVHAHHAWCAFAVHRGAMTETFYRPGGERTGGGEPGGEGHDPVPVAAHLRRPGDVSQGPADPSMIHRLANLSCGEAVSLHAYGIAFERFPTGLNLVYSA